jgi:hypothetical protein
MVDGRRKLSGFYTSGEYAVKLSHISLSHISSGIQQVVPDTCPEDLYLN